MIANPPPWRFSVVATVLAILLALCALALTSCGTTREEQQHAVTDVLRRFSVKGTVEVPATRPSDGQTVFLPVGVDVVIDGGGSDETTGEAKARTTIDAPEIGGAVVTALKQAFPALGLLGVGQEASTAPDHWTNMDTGAVSAAGIALAGMLQRHLAARAARQDAEDEHQRADDEKKRADEHRALAVAAMAQVATKAPA